MFLIRFYLFKSPDLIFQSNIWLDFLCSLRGYENIFKLIILIIHFIVKSLTISVIMIVCIWLKHWNLCSIAHNIILKTNLFAWITKKIQSDSMSLFFYDSTELTNPIFFPVLLYFMFFSPKKSIVFNVSRYQCKKIDGIWNYIFFPFSIHSLFNIELMNRKWKIK